MVNGLKYAALASIMILGAAPVALAQGAGNGGGATAAAPRANGENPAYLTQSITRYSMRHDGNMGFVGDRVRPRGDETRQSTETARNPAYLTQRLESYGNRAGGNGAGHGTSGSGGSGGAEAGENAGAGGAGGGSASPGGAGK